MRESERVFERGKRKRERENVRRRKRDREEVCERGKRERKNL